MATTNMFAALSEDFDLQSLSAKSSSMKDSKKKSSLPKKPVDHTANKIASIQFDLADFTDYYPIAVILYHHDGKDKFEISNLKFSHSFFIECFNREVKKLTLPMIEQIINDKRKNLGEVLVWSSYFTTDTLKKLADQEPFETPSEFKTTFDLVRGEPITHFRCSRVIVFDFRVSNKQQEFVYLAGGSRIYFGKKFDDYCVQQRRHTLESMLKHYERSLKHFDLGKVYNARDEIFSLTNERNEDDREIRNTAFECERFIARYVHIHDDDEEIEFRNLLQYKNWADDMKNDYERAMEYRDKLFALVKEVRDMFKRREIARKLTDKEEFPSL